jgi:DMSO/TMAO reductase YedYZ molybdopterin-dependent catalytic subunit
LTSSEAAREDVIIAYLLNGNPIQEKMRLVVPYRNGDQWISDIVEIRVIDISGDYSTIYISS